MYRHKHTIPSAWLPKEAGFLSRYSLPISGTIIGGAAGSNFDDNVYGEVKGTIIGGVLGGLGGRALRKPMISKVVQPIQEGRKTYPGSEKTSSMGSNTALGYGMQAAGTVIGGLAGSNLNGQNDHYGTMGGMIAGAVAGSKLKGLVYTKITNPYKRGKAPSAPKGPEPTSAKTDVPPTGNSETSKPAASKPGFFSRFGFGKKQNPAGEPPKPAQPAGAEYSMNNRPSNSAYKNMKNSVDADNAKLQGEDPSYHKFASKLAAFRRW